MKRTEMPDTIKETEKSGHNGDSRLTVYIFGAGASVSGGYPAAAKFAGELEQYLIRLAGAPPERKVDRLKRTISSTLKHLKETGAQTIDELVGTLDDTSAVEDAKTATETLFLDLETRLTPQNLRDYSSFLVRACLSPAEGTEKSLRSDVRVMTFNYDRTLEIAYALLTKKVAINRETLNSPVSSHVKDLRQLYYPLNTGFQTGEEYFLEKGHFAFLKLHGSVGLKLPRQDPNIKHQQPFHVGTILDDDMLWRENGELKVPSLIVFPHEKAEITNENIANLPTFHDYIAKLENDATEAIQIAREVHICGYSVCQPKWTRFEEIVKHSPPDCKFIVHDPCDIPFRRLKPIVYPRAAFHVQEDFSEAW